MPSYTRVYGTVAHTWAGVFSFIVVCGNQKSVFKMSVRRDRSLLWHQSCLGHLIGHFTLFMSTFMLARVLSVSPVSVAPLAFLSLRALVEGQGVLWTRPSAASGQVVSVRDSLLTMLRSSSLLSCGGCDSCSFMHFFLLPHPHFGGAYLPLFPEREYMEGKFRGLYISSVFWGWCYKLFSWFFPLAVKNLHLLSQLSFIFLSLSFSKVVPFLLSCFLCICRFVL